MKVFRVPHDPPFPVRFRGDLVRFQLAGGSIVTASRTLEGRIAALLGES